MDQRIPGLLEYEGFGSEGPWAPGVSIPHFLLLFRAGAEREVLALRAVPDRAVLEDVFPDVFLEAVEGALARPGVPLLRPLPFDLFSFFPKIASYPSAKRGSSAIPTRTILTVAYLRSNATN